MTEETTVVVDRNEPERLRMLTLAHPDVDEWTEEFLDAADIVVNGVGIERKTASDFASAMLEDRLDEQVRKLTDAYDDAAILLEADGFHDFSDLKHTRLKPQSLRGKAASIHMRHGIPVIPTGGPPGAERGYRRLVDYGIRLGRKGSEKPSSGYLRGSVVGSDAPVGERMWGCMDGVGPERAGSLYDRVGGPVEFVSAEDRGALVDELVAIDGIGEKTAQRLVEQLRGGSDADHRESEGSAESGHTRPETDAGGGV